MLKLSHQIYQFVGFSKITSRKINYIRNAIPSRNYVNNTPETTLEIPLYPVDKPQSLEHRRARLIYQSRKRGMLENDLLLSTFAKKYLNTMNEEEVLMYDRLINSPTNDWDIFNWIIGKNETPKEFDNKIMDLLKEHAKNNDKKSLKQPDL